MTLGLGKRAGQESALFRSEMDKTPYVFYSLPNHAKSILREQIGVCTRRSDIGDKKSLGSCPY